MKRLTLAFGLLAGVFALWTPSVGAWNDGGHRLIAVIAHELLDADVRSAVVASLQQHPRYAQDFRARMPNAVRNGSAADRSRWLFGQAAAWPDIARDQPTYHHATWHYINKPVFLTDEDAAGMPESSLPVNLKLTLDANDDENKLNVIQALAKAQNGLASSSMSARNKAVLLTWLFHLVGDIHQPLHGAALFSRQQLQAGDRGGNRLKIGSDSLHSYWDAALRISASPSALLYRARNYRQNSTLRKLGEGAESELSPVEWMKESHTFATDSVYDNEILEAVMDWIDNPRGRQDPRVRLDSGYDEMARDLADRRAVEAGYRLAAVLRLHFH